MRIRNTQHKQKRLWAILIDFFKRFFRQKIGCIRYMIADCGLAFNYRLILPAIFHTFMVRTIKHQRTVGKSHRLLGFKPAGTLAAGQVPLPDIRGSVSVFAHNVRKCPHVSIHRNVISVGAVFVRIQSRHKTTAWRRTDGTNRIKIFKAHPVFRNCVDMGRFYFTASVTA